MIAVLAAAVVALVAALVVGMVGQRRLAHRLGVESREGEGSTFTLRLPVGSGPVAITAEAG